MKKTPKKIRECFNLVVGSMTALAMFIGPTLAIGDDHEEETLWDAPGEEHVIGDGLSAYEDDVMILYPDGPPDVFPAWVYKQDGLPFAALTFNHSGFAIAFVESAYTPEELQMIADSPLFGANTSSTGTLILNSNAVRLNAVVIKTEGFDPTAFREDDDYEDDEEEEEEEDDYEDDEEGEDDEEEGEEHEEDDYEDDEEGEDDEEEGEEHEEEDDEDEEEDDEEEEEDDDGLEDITLKLSDERVVELRALILRDAANNVVGADVCGKEECCWIIVDGVIKKKELDELTMDPFLIDAKDAIEPVIMQLEDGSEVPGLAFVEGVDFAAVEEGDEEGEEPAEGDPGEEEEGEEKEDDYEDEEEGEEEEHEGEEHEEDDYEDGEEEEEDDEDDDDEDDDDEDDDDDD